MGNSFGNPVIPNDQMRAVLKLCVEWYRVDENECGGILHIVLDDDNVDDGFLEWCRKRTTDEKAIAILDGLQPLTVMQRLWVTYNIYNVKDGLGEREVLEEINE